MSRFTSTFSMSDESIFKLQNVIQQANVSIERTVNTYLRDTGAKKLKESMTYLTPVSERGKRHAKYNKPFKHDNINLGVILSPESKFYYLGFVDEGSGTSWRYQRHIGFFKRGVESAEDEIVNDLLNEIIKQMEGR